MRAQQQVLTNGAWRPAMCWRCCMLVTTLSPGHTLIYGAPFNTCMYGSVPCLRVCTPFNSTVP